MPQSKFQEVVFTVFMAAVMVYGMVCYNIALNLGGLSDAVFGRVFGEWPIMTVAAKIIKKSGVLLGKAGQRRPHSHNVGHFCGICLDDVPLYEFDCHASL